MMQEANVDAFVVHVTRKHGIQTYANVTNCVLQGGVMLLTFRHDDAKTICIPLTSDVVEIETGKMPTVN